MAHTATLRHPPGNPTYAPASADLEQDVFCVALMCSPHPSPCPGYQFYCCYCNWIPQIPVPNWVEKTSWKEWPSVLATPSSPSEPSQPRTPNPTASSHWTIGLDWGHRNHGAQLSEAGGEKKFPKRNRNFGFLLPPQEMSQHPLYKKWDPAGPQGGIGSQSHQHFLSLCLNIVSGLSN